MAVGNAPVAQVRASKRGRREFSASIVASQIREAFLDTRKKDSYWNYKESDIVFSELRCTNCELQTEIAVRCRGKWSK
jgi:hypothetical protein